MTARPLTPCHSIITSGKPSAPECEALRTCKVWLITQNAMATIVTQAASARETHRGSYAAVMISLIGCWLDGGKATPLQRVRGRREALWNGIRNGMGSQVGSWLDEGKIRKEGRIERAL